MLVLLGIRVTGNMILRFIYFRSFYHFLPWLLSPKLQLLNRWTHNPVKPMVSNSSKRKPCCYAPRVTLHVFMAHCVLNLEAESNQVWAAIQECRPEKWTCLNLAQLPPSFTVNQIKQGENLSFRDLSFGHILMYCKVLNTDMFRKPWTPWTSRPLLQFLSFGTRRMILNGPTAISPP